MDKAHILREIRRTAEANGGVALGYRTFESETGIRPSDWLGTHWARWNDALREAGLAPNEMKPPTPLEELLDKFAKFAQELGRLPVFGDHHFKERRDPEFPGRSTYTKRFGSKTNLVHHLLVYCRDREEYEDVVRMSEEFICSQHKKKETRKLRPKYAAGSFIFSSMGHEGNTKSVARTIRFGARARSVLNSLSKLSQFMSLKLMTHQALRPIGIDALLRSD